MTTALYEVVPLELHLRSNTKVVPSSVIARLRQGQQVKKLMLNLPAPAGWLYVQADLQGTAVEGYVKASFLKAITIAGDVPQQPAVLPNIPEARLASPTSIRLTQNGDGPRVYDLTEAHQPGRPGPTAIDKAAQLGAIVGFLRVSQSPRYAAGGGKTYCNIYAHDYCHLAGTFLPRVWWTSKALVALAAGQAVRPAYGTTVREQNVNSLYSWLEDFGPDFGWRRSVNLTELQNAANTGQICIICAQRTHLNLPGHICAVVPETAQHHATRKGESVTVPLMSQAGSTNFEYSSKGRAWWTDPRFARHSFWIHA